ncbi:RlpA-like double-psi beta-barrel domain-containing protein [Rhodotorula paludigena]|uniref:RlpA-like double-psi beta-barrel domain-containing protein n=1 Tax=Rhodotorula paludigena TaxID=86838 RepID=UPI00316B0E4A
MLTSTALSLLSAASLATSAAAYHAPSLHNHGIRSGHAHAHLARDFVPVRSALDRRAAAAAKAANAPLNKRMQKRVRRSEVAPRSADNAVLVTRADAGTKQSSTAIWWKADGWSGSCDTAIDNSAMQVGLPLSVYPDVRTKSSLCGTSIEVTAPSTGKSVTVTVVTAANRDEYTTFSKAAYEALGGDFDTGMLPVEFYAEAVASVETTSAAAATTTQEALKTAAKIKAVAQTTTTTTTTQAPAKTTSAAPAATTSAAPVAEAAASSDDDDDWVCDDDEEASSSDDDDEVCDEETSSAAAPASTSAAREAWKESTTTSATPKATTTSAAPATTEAAKTTTTEAVTTTTTTSAQPQATKVADTGDSVTLLTQLNIQGFRGANGDAILSWYNTNSGQDSTNGNSWCGFPYDNSVPGFAPSLKTMLNNFGGNYEAAAKAYCGLEAEITTPDGRTSTLYIADAFDDTWVLTPSSLDIIHGSFEKLYGSWTDNKNDVVKGASWKLTGGRNERLTFKSTNSLGGW